MFRLCLSASSFCLVALVVAALRLCEASPGSSSLALLSRQLAKPDLPSSGESQSCDNQCSVLSTLDDCETDQCFCTDSNSDGLASCLDCLVATGNGTMSQGQTVMNDYIDDCAELGFTVKNETIKASGAGALSIPVAGAAATALLAILWA